ncbi:MAG: radical SAM protein [Acidimicrobiales bacterium]
MAVTALAEAIEAGAVSPRLWMYSNYHCNLACTYCLTESAPNVPRRELGAERMVELAAEARALGFTALGVTGGEPFLQPDMPELLGRLAAMLPVVCLSNGTVFSESRLDRLRALAGLAFHLQVSLDRPEPVANDVMRGPDNFRNVVDAIPRLVERGIGVRVATTLDGPVDEAEMARLCELHRGLGVPDEDHVVRPIVSRGRAASAGLGVAAGAAELNPELTITADGAFWSPFGPTVVGGRLDTDMLVTRTTRPLATPTAALLRLVQGRPPGVTPAWASAEHDPPGPGRAHPPPASPYRDLPRGAPWPPPLPAHLLPAPPSTRPFSTPPSTVTAARWSSVSCASSSVCSGSPMPAGRRRPTSARSAAGGCSRS